MKALTALLLLLIINPSSPIRPGIVKGTCGPASSQSSDNEITTLLSKLSPKITKTESRTTIEGPSADLQEQVSRLLLEMANESPESRARVIQALVQVVEDPTAKQDLVDATRWVTAVRVLGKLKATEAIDVLIDNLDQTGHAIRISLHSRPVVRAVISIGEPAVPKLIEALSNYKPSIRREAASALAEIGGKEAMKAIEQAAATETDEYVLGTLRAILPSKTPAAKIEVSRDASNEACAGGQIVAASFLVFGGDSAPVMQQTACTRAPVEITRMVVGADGSCTLFFRNLDGRRKIVGVSYWVTPLDGQVDAEARPDFVASLLAKPAEPGAEIVDNPERAHDRIKLGKTKTYLVSFIGVLFDDMSEWQFRADCSSSNDSQRITCKAAKQ